MSGATQFVASSLEPRGPAAEEIAGLWWLMLALGAVVYVAVLVLLVLGLLRRRRGSPADLGAVPVPDGRTGVPWMVGGGVVMPSVLLVVVLVATLAAMRDDEPPPGALAVEVVGHQWWWEVRYPGSGLVTANEMHVPAGRPVALTLSSGDVIHSFWVPALAGKMDLLPDHPTRLLVEAEAPGVYRGQCAEFCGLQHALMAFLVVAETETEFADWVTRQSRPAAEPTGEIAARGRDVFLGAGCAECHTVAGTEASGRDGPDLTHVASRRTLAAGTVANTTESLRAWISDPHAVKEGVLMPAQDLSDEDLDALVAYLEGLD